MPRKLIKSFSHAFSGIAFAFLSQRNMRIHFAIAAAIIFSAFIFGLDLKEASIIVLLVFFVLVVELINTIIEELADLLMPGHNRKVQVIKDMAAAAVLLASLCAIILGCFIFMPYILRLFSGG